MDIYLLRHGIAEEGDLSQHDSNRALTDEGIEKLREVLRVAKKAGVSPSMILSSPYIRARQTADLAKEILKVEHDIVETYALKPMSQPREAWDDIRALREEPAILLASHEPLMGQLLGFLLATPGLQVEFRKGALAKVTVNSFGPSPRGVFNWFLTAKLAQGA